MRIGPILSARIEFGPELFHIGPDFLLEGGGGGRGRGGFIRMGGGGQCFPRKTSLLFVQAKINLGLGEGGGLREMIFPSRKRVKNKRPPLFKKRK